MVYVLEVVCALLNGDIVDEVSDHNHPKYPHL